MTSQRTEVRGLTVRRWINNHYEAPGMEHTPQYRRFMYWVGQCIKRGGAVTITTYVVEHHGYKGAYDKLDATLDWRGT